MCRPGSSWPAAPASLIARCRDLGAAGACLRTDSAFPVEAARRVILGLPSGPLCLEVRGCWQRGGAEAISGLAFQRVPTAALATLSQFVGQRCLQLAGFLRAQEALRELAPEELAWLTRALRFRHVMAGESIYLQDGAAPEGDALFVLADGSVILEGHAARGEAVTVARLRPGALFGGLPLLGSVPHAESARARSDCLLLALQRDAFEHVKAERPRLARALSRAATRAYTERLQQLLKRVRYHS